MDGSTESEDQEWTPRACNDPPRPNESEGARIDRLRTMADGIRERLSPADLATLVRLLEGRDFTGDVYIHDFADRVLRLSHEWYNRFREYAEDMNGRTVTPFSESSLMNSANGQAVHVLLEEIGSALYGFTSLEGVRRAADALNKTDRTIPERRGAAISLCDQVIRFWLEITRNPRSERIVFANGKRSSVDGATIARWLISALEQQNSKFGALKSDYVARELEALNRKNASPVKLLFKLASRVGAWNAGKGGGPSIKSFEGAWTEWKKNNLLPSS